MIKKETILKVVDNSGGVLVKCIDNYSTKGNIGDIILISVKKIKNKKKILNVKLKVEKHNKYKALILQTKKGLIRSDGSHIFFNLNSVLLLNLLNKKSIGTRLQVALLKEFYNKKFIQNSLMSSKRI